jgi:hypothetical protein
MLALPDLSMMALDTNGPMNDEVFPIIEKMAKKRNWKRRGRLDEPVQR